MNKKCLDMTLIPQNENIQKYSTDEINILQRKYTQVCTKQSSEAILRLAMQ